MVISPAGGDSPGVAGASTILAKSGSCTCQGSGEGFSGLVFVCVQKFMVLGGACT